MAKKRSRVPGSRLVEHIQQLISRGDVRRVCLLDEERSILEIPVVLGDPASPAAVLEGPILAAINAFAALVDECTVEVEDTSDQLSKKEEAA